MSKTVLIVDDDPKFRELLVTILAPRGWRVFEAGKASDAVKILNGRDKPDLLIIDGLLPDTNGVKLIEDLREKGDQTVIFFVSAFFHDIATFRRLTEDLQVSMVMKKPININEFQLQLDRFEGRRGPAVEEELELDFIDESFKSAGSKTETEVGSPDANLADALVNLRRNYKSTLKNQLFLLKGILNNLGKGSTERSLLEHAHTVSHKIHGTAGSYGFALAGHAAGIVERTVTDVILNRTPLESIPWHLLESAVNLDEIFREMDRKLTEDSGAIEIIHGWSYRVLVASEDSRLIDDLTGVCTKFSAEIIPVLDMSSALERASDGHFDAFLIDASRGDGSLAFELGRALRDMPSKVRPAIGFIAERPDFAKRVAAVHAGASLFIGKPPLESDLDPLFEEIAASRRREVPTILVVDDNDEFQRQLAAILEADNMRAAALNRPEKILETLAATNPDLVLLDVMYKHQSGFDVCRMLRTSAEWRDLPIIFVTAHLSDEVRLSCFEAGGDDYIAKPIAKKELLARIRVRLDRRRLLREKILKDPLTGLLNRRAFIDMFARSLDESRRKRTELAVCILDLDAFGLVNRLHGHNAGDRVLVELGRLLQSRFRTYDIVGRWSGKEFITAFPGVGASTAQGIMERVLDELNHKNFEGDQAERFNVTVSGGTSAYPADGDSFDTLARRADMRLQAVKRAGGAAIRSLDPEPAPEPEPDSI